MTGVVDSITGTFHMAYYRYHDWKTKRSPAYKKAEAERVARREEEKRFEEELLKRTVTEIIPVENFETFLKKAADKRRALADSVKDRMEANPYLYEVYSFGDVPAEYLSTWRLKTAVGRHLDRLSKVRDVPMAAAREELHQCNVDLPRPDSEEGFYAGYFFNENHDRISLDVRKKMGSGVRWIGCYTVVTSVPVADVRYRAPEK
jgi:hypothetical protein